MIGALVAVTVTGYLWFGSNYHSLTWPFHAPEPISMHGRDYQRDCFPPLDEPLEFDRLSMNRMMPFGYPILGYAGYETSTVVYLQWHDGGTTNIRCRGAPERPTNMAYRKCQVTRSRSPIAPIFD